MHDLRPETVEAFMDRFCNFYDSVLRLCTMSVSTKGKLSCDVRLEAQDDQSPSGWSNVTIRVHGFKYVHLDRQRSGIEVLSFGLQVFFLDDTVRVYLDGDPVREKMLELDESLAVVIGASVQWEAEHIPL
jgi:hypothetical protein